MGKREEKEIRRKGEDDKGRGDGKEKKFGILNGKGKET